jgi:hypothetical protein
MSSNNDTNNTPSTINDNENEDEIKKYSKNIDGRGQYTIIAVFEGNYVRFARELDNGNLAKEKILSQEEFEKNDRTRRMEKSTYLS